jgi:glyoxylase-like metal-dependent hydrolase (beta-lactamase superfamily II)
MKVDHFVLGAFETNSYVLRESDQAKNCLVIDTGLDANELIEFLNSNDLSVEAVILTHGHADHIAALPDLRQQYPQAKVFIHKLDAKMLTGEEDNLSAMAGMPLTVGPADVLVDDGDVIDQAGVKLEIMHTPGHSPGGICLYAPEDGIVFVGDTLFAGSIGRSDFPGSSPTQLIASIRERLLELPDETIACPGHGPTTTITSEKQFNPFLR